MMRARRLAATGTLALTIGAACAHGRTAQSPTISLSEESALLARIAGCARRPPRWAQTIMVDPNAPFDLWPRLAACAGTSSCDALVACSGVEMRRGDLVCPACDVSRASRAARGAPCSARFETGKAFQCDGDALVSCVGGHIHRVECADLVEGSRCGAHGNDDRPSFGCLRARECDPDDRAGPRCDGTRLTFCNAGHVVRVDCAALGFATCLGQGCALPIEAR